MKFDKKKVALDKFLREQRKTEKRKLKEVKLNERKNENGNKHQNQNVGQ